jgi:hypothetical protein
VRGGEGVAGSGGVCAVREARVCPPDSRACGQAAVAPRRARSAPTTATAAGRARPCRRGARQGRPSGMRSSALSQLGPPPIDAALPHALPPHPHQPPQARQGGLRGGDADAGAHIL